MMVPAPNFVVVRPDAAHGDSGGVVVSRFVDDHRGRAFSGVVEAVCPTLRYLGRDYHRIDRDKAVNPEWLRRLALRCWETSCLYDVPVEVEAGDRVWFNYIHNVEDSQLVGDGLLLVPYHDLHLRERGTRPLNGKVIVAVEPDAGDEFRAPTDTDADGVGVVVAAGCLVASYLDDVRYADADEDIVGRRVVFGRRKARPMEAREHSTLSANGFPLCWMHRIDLLAVVEEEY